MADRKTRVVVLSTGFTIEVHEPFGASVPLTFHRTGSMDPFPSELQDFEVWSVVRALVGAWVRAKVGRVVRRG